MMPEEKKSEEKKPESNVGSNPVAYTVKMHTKPQVAPDGHVNLTEEDIRARK